LPIYYQWQQNFKRFNVDEHEGCTSYFIKNNYMDKKTLEKEA
jgi:hypothetical protein